MVKELASASEIYERDRENHVGYLFLEQASVVTATTMQNICGKNDVFECRYKLERV